MKVIIVTMMAIMSIIGFMIKLPRVFSAYDKELHFFFYFCVTLLISWLFIKSRYVYHILICFTLFTFGVCIEQMQEFSNELVTKRIHGNFDPEDITYNTLGIMYAFILFTTYRAVKIMTDNRK